MGSVSHLFLYSWLDITKKRLISQYPLCYASQAMVKLAINGFGRIGRVSFRIALEHPQEIKVAAINTSGSMEAAGWAHLFKYDTAYGPYQKEVTSDQNHLMIGQQKIPLSGEREPAKLPWRQYDIDVVLEATGVFRDQAGVNGHLQAGAKKVLISAPTKDEKIPTYLVGVNLDQYQGEEIIDGGSCTTNCAAPVLKVILENFGINKAFLTTVHAYTGDQNLQDSSRQDLRRARAAGQNIIPTSTGAIQAVAKAIPQLKGKLDGLAVRVPVITGSLLDLAVILEKETDADAINRAFLQASQSDLKNILTTTQEPLVSSDIIANPHSAIVDLERTQVIGNNFAKIIAWYDNEWATSQRLIETVIQIGNEKNV